MGIALRQQVTDQGSSGKYFALMLHIDDDDLDPYEYRLLGHYRRVCGSTNKPCYESTLTTAKITRMSDDKVRSTRDRLEMLGRIIVDKPAGSTVKVTICDLMAKNVERYHGNPSEKQEGYKRGNPSRKQEGGATKNGRGTPPGFGSQRITIEEESSKNISFAPASQDAVAVPSFPDAPKGYTWVSSADSDQPLAHLTTGCLTSLTLCKHRLMHRNFYKPGQRLNPRQPCGDCLKAAAEKQAKVDRPKAYASQPVFEALAEVVFGITDPQDIGELGGRIGPIRERLIGHVLKKRAVPDLDEPTLAELVIHLKRFGKWYDEHCKGCPRPTTANTFMSNWLQYTKKAATNNNKPHFDPKTATWSKQS